jgi:hypothetical protein
MASLREMYVGMFGVEFDARAVTNPSASSVSRAGSGSAVSGVNGYNGYHYVPSGSASASGSYAQLLMLMFLIPVLHRVGTSRRR